MEILTIKSFLAHGFHFHLWIYNPLITKIPEGVQVHDASEIIPRHDVFNYKFRNQFGHGKGSYAGFSDIFRYKLLYEYGGWWTDMDVTCLKKPDFQSDYVFRTHHSLPLVGNIMKVPAKSALMKDCYEEASKRINAYNKDWHLPIDILCKHVEAHGLSKHIQEFTNPDSWNLIRKLLAKPFSPPENWYMLHWVNEEWRRNRISKLRVIDHSFLGSLLKKHDVLFKKAKGGRKLRYLYKLSAAAYLFRRYL